MRAFPIFLAEVTVNVGRALFMRMTFLLPLAVAMVNTAVVRVIISPPFF
jgi:hypothetical protein